MGRVKYSVGQVFEKFSIIKDIPGNSRSNQRKVTIKYHECSHEINIQPEKIPQLYYLVCKNCKTIKKEFRESKRIGMQVGLRTIISYEGKNKWNDHIYKVKCICSKENIIVWQRLMRTISCKQCCAKRIGNEHLFKHGYASRELYIDELGNTKRKKHFHIYNIWTHIRDRCLNPKSKSYKDYGGRGIKICDRWSSFENFIEDIGDRPIGYQLDRINNDGNYEPANCKWSSSKENNNNRRTSKKYKDKWKQILMPMDEYKLYLKFKKQISKPKSILKAENQLSLF
jgi:hypothetical protein